MFSILFLNIKNGGPVIYPLLGCSLISVALILERLIVHLRYPRIKAELRTQQYRNRQVHTLAAVNRGLLAGLQLLSRYRAYPKSVREEVLSIWLLDERRKLLAHTRWLILHGTLAPLLGLLGTVLGILVMFQDVSQHTGPVTPALLAAGMWQAMLTTALGIIIAIPALVAGHGLNIWTSHRMEIMSAVLNECDLFEETALIDSSSLFDDSRDVLAKAIDKVQPAGIQQAPADAVVNRATSQSEFSPDLTQGQRA